MKQDGTQPSTAAALLPWLGIGLAIALLWAVVIPGVQRPAGDERSLWASSDYRTYFLPKWSYGSQEILAGRLPLWNPFEATGLPLLGAMQPAALYPPKILAFAAPDAGRATRLFLVAHFLLLAGGFLWFARGRGIGPFGAFAGAAFWTFHFGILLSNYHPGRIANLAWIPIVFALADRSVRGSRAAWLGLAAAVAAMLLAGYFVFVSDTALLLGVVAAASWACGAWSQAPHRSWPLLGAAFVAGALLASAQLLPVLEVVAQSERAALAGQQMELFVRKVTPIVLLGPVAGVPALIGLGLGGLRRRQALPPLAGWLLALLVLLGGWKLLRLLPGLSAMRHPLTWTFVGAFPLAWLVAVGSDALAAPRDARERWLGSGVLGAVGAAWGLYCLARWLGPASLWPPPAPLMPDFHAVAGPPGELGLPGLLGLVAAAALLLAAFRPGAVRRAALALALAAAVAGQIASFPFGVPQDALDRPGLPVRSLNLGLPSGLGQGRVLSLPDLAHGFSARDRVENLLGVESSVMPPRFAALQEWLGVNVLRQRMSWRKLAGAPGLLDALDVSAVVAPRQFQRALEGSGLRDTGRGDEQRVVLANDDRPGRAWVVYGVRQVDDSQAALDRLLAPGFDPRREVVVEETLEGRYPPGSPLPPTPAGAHYPRPSRAEIEVELERPGILVLADACTPGWQAWVNERPARWFCANYLTRGLELEAGRQRVRFEYRPRAVAAGIALSLASAALLLLAALWLGWWSRRR